MVRLKHHRIEWQCACVCVCAERIAQMGCGSSCIDFRVLPYPTKIDSIMLLIDDSITKTIHCQPSDINIPTFCPNLTRCGAEDYYCVTW